MSRLFDQNLSRRLPVLLAAEFPGSEHVYLVGMADGDDRSVWNDAAALGLAVVSKDADFRAFSLTFGAPPQVIWLRVGNGPTRMIEMLLRANTSIIRAFLNDPTQPLLELP